MQKAYKRPRGLLWILWFKGALGCFAIVLGAVLLRTGDLDVHRALVRIGVDQIGSDATGMAINFIVPYTPVLKHDLVRALAMGFIVFGIIKLFLVVELYQMKEWARVIAIWFFLLLLPVELVQLIITPATSSRALSVALNMLIIWYLWKVLPRIVARRERALAKEI